MRRVEWSVVCVAVAMAGACKPGSVAEAEAKGDVPWLAQSDSPEAVAALGRLADKRPDAAQALAGRSSYDPEAFHPAWDAVMRGAPWGAAMLHDGLHDPKRADRAAAAMAKGDPRLAPFLDDLAGALERLSASPQNANIATTLASLGPPARDEIAKLLADAATRGPMCFGIGAPEASADARQAMLDAPSSSRDAPQCVAAVVTLAAGSDAALAWVAERGEPALLGAASKSASVPCAQLHTAWVKAFAARPEGEYPELTVPLGSALTRCAPQLDGILADAIAHKPGFRAVVVGAIDPFGNYGSGLRATCAALPAVTSGHDTAIVRERASDALLHACKASG